MSNHPSPRVSIGLPVYNGDKYLEEAIESILAQTYRDFELIISDNASTDRTPEICQRYAESDPRIRYYRNATNIGGANNANRTFQLAQGEYFRWAAHDDVCAPLLLEKCVAELDAHPEVYLCYMGIIEIDEARHERPTPPYWGVTSSLPFTRFRVLSKRSHRCEAMYGLIRTSALRETGLIGNYTDADRVLLCELGLQGRFAYIPEPLFYKRVHRGNTYKDWRGRMAWYYPSLAQTGRITFPNWCSFFDYFRVIHRSSAAWHQRLLCYLWLSGPWPVLVGRGMARDVVVAAQMLVRSKEARKQLYADVDRWS